MQHSLPKVRPLSSASRPNLLTQICGRPPLFSLEQQLLNWLVGCVIVLVLLFAAENAILGIPFVGALLPAAILYIGIYYLGRFKHVPTRRLGHIVFAANMLVITLAWVAAQGIDGSTWFLYLATLVCIMSVFRGWPRIAWTCAMFVHLGAMIAMQYLLPAWISPYPSQSVQRFDIVFTFLCIAVYLMGYVAVTVYNLDERRKVADALLLNIMPEVIAEKLKYSPAEVLAQHYSNASVLFADIVEFTPLSAGLAPGELVKFLNSVFSYFDSLADKYGVEKIKTIGDCYMVAAGVPTERTDHAQTLTRLALEMRDYVGTHGFEGKQLSVRIGINSGAVVAGVIGRRKFAYDLWGDTVNTASRMESHGRPNAIQVTWSTYELIKDDFICQPQGRIHVKSKGEMEVWHVLAART